MAVSRDVWNIKNGKFLSDRCNHSIHHDRNATDTRREVLPKFWHLDKLSCDIERDNQVSVDNFVTYRIANLNTWCREFPTSTTRLMFICYCYLVYWQFCTARNSLRESWVRWFDNNLIWFFKQSQEPKNNQFCPYACIHQNKSISITKRLHLTYRHRNKTILIDMTLWRIMNTNKWSSLVYYSSANKWMS